MDSIMKAIDHLCNNIMKGSAQGRGWEAKEVDRLAAGVQHLAQAAEILARIAPPPELTPEDALQAVAYTCHLSPDCVSCVLKEWCDKYIDADDPKPDEWELTDR